MRLVFIERLGLPINAEGSIYKKGDDFGLQKCIISSNNAEITKASESLGYIYRANGFF